MADPSSLSMSPCNFGAPPIPPGSKFFVNVTPLQDVRGLPGRIGGISAYEASPRTVTDQFSQYLCLDPNERTAPSHNPSQDDLVALERILRNAALSGDSQLLVSLNAQPAIEDGSGNLLPLLPPPPSYLASDPAKLFGLLRGAGIHQLMSFPIARFNGIGLPPGAQIRFADPSRWFQAGAMESRLFTISTNGKQYYSWDAHSPVGKTPHDFYHINQKGMYGVFGQSNHAPIVGPRLFQAKQLRYLKIGGRVFLVVGVVVDTAQMGSAAVESYQRGSVKPIAAQSIRTAGRWAMAWAGAKAGMAAGGLAGVESGPGMVLTAIGGGLIGGTAGYFGADWIADWIYED